MKALRNALLAFILLPVCAQAQYSKFFTFSGYGGYTFNDRVRLSNVYHADVKGAFQWGLGVEYHPAWDNSVELSYNRMSTHIPLYGPGGTHLNAANDKGSLDFILIGGNHYFGHAHDSKVKPYIGAGLGVGILSGPNASSTKFAWDTKLGVKVQASPIVAVKLQAYVQSIISTFGTNYWYGFPGVIFAVPNYVTSFQFGLSGGLCFTLKGK
jgi:opacity protein-like surface antigen